MADDISRLLEQTCCAFIPEYYDGVLEALRIQQINDAEIEPFVSSIMRLFRNSYIKTADIDYVEELEDGLGIGHEGTFEQRREAIINELNNVFIANDENIITLAMSIFGGDNLEMITDCKRLITIITTALNNEDSMYAVESLKYVYMALAPLLPQNIDFRVGVHSSNVINVKYEYGWTTHLHTELGSIEYVEPENYIDVLLYLRGDQDIPQSKSFAANDYWWPCIQSQQSRTALQSFGVNVTSMDTAFDTGNGMILFDDVNFDYELLGLYTDNGQTQATTNLSNFFVSNHSNQGDLCVTIDSINAFSTPCLSWKLRIRKAEEPEETFTAYSRSASYQNSNQTLQTAVYTAIYEPGSNNVVAGDTHKDYEIIGMWNAAGTALQFEHVGLSCYLYNGNPRIRIMNKRSSSISWNHIEYKAHDVFRFYSRDDRADYALYGSKAAYNRNGIQTIERTANETYTIVGVYMADGTQIPTPADLEVSYASSLRQIKISTQYEHTFAYVDVVVSGGDAPTTASALSLDNDEEM